MGKCSPRSEKEGRAGIGSGIRWGKLTTKMFLKSVQSKACGSLGPPSLPALTASKGQGAAFSAKVEEGKLGGWDRNQMRLPCAKGVHVHACVYVCVLL